MFTLRKIEGGRINVHEPLSYPVGDEAVTEGQALVLSSGKLVKATGKPTFIALASGAAKSEIPVGRVEANQVYEVPVTAAPTSLTVGAKVTVAETGLGVTATTSNGVAEIVDLNGAIAANDTIYVRFS